MKFNFSKLVLIFLIVSIITASPSSATKIASEKGEVDQEINYTESDASVDSFGKQKVDLEECGNGDEECLMRRAVLEAHLDYIYTQNRVP